MFNKPEAIKPPLSEKELRDKLEEIFKTKPISGKEYFDNLMQYWSPTMRKQFDTLLKEEAERFLGTQKKHKYFKEGLNEK